MSKTASFLLLSKKGISKVVAERRTDESYKISEKRGGWGRKSRPTSFIAFGNDIAQFFPKPSGNN
jgi:hypothetical protein